MNKSTLVVGSAVVVLAAVIYWKLTPTPANRHAMETAASSSSEDGVSISEVKVPSEFSSLAQMGEKAFNAKCAACHGANATGLEGLAPPLVHKIYEPSHHGDEAFYRAVQNGVRAHHWSFGDMPPVEGLTRGDVKGIVAYIRELQQENGIR
ncbi:c-type cytochrome [Parasedimentitalea maritima]|uniref:C-type cytochrome n=1 Tax=Parasedimentitalea maritima TaxID=2578117 RepID=A0A6A4RCQ8_9RHOB|nr:cytochrome c [Zongyanglinia marina]KAE9625893.1 c-type cytochrome [Zongyanglinia marina]